MSAAFIFFYINLHRCVISKISRDVTIITRQSILCILLFLNSSVFVISFVYCFFQMNTFSQANPNTFITMTLQVATVI